MKIRAFVLGLIGVVAICGLSYLNDRVLRGTYLIGNNLPIAVYGFLVIFLLLLNPLLGKLRLSGKELAVILGMVLVSCCIPGSGLMRTFTDVLILPWQYQRTKPAWKGSTPQVQMGDLSSPEKLAEAIRKNSLLKQFSAQLPPDTRAWLQKESGDTRPDQVIRVLNTLIYERVLLKPEILREEQLSSIQKELAGREAEALTEKEAMILGRKALTLLFPGYVKPRMPSIIELVPDYMLVNMIREHDDVLNRFLWGIEESTSKKKEATSKTSGEAGGTEKKAKNATLGLEIVPWKAWLTPLKFWIPLILMLWFLVLALGLIVHRQWSRHEHLPYPIVNFTSMLLPDDETGKPVVYRQRSFWIACGIIFFIHSFNYLNSWFPQYTVKIPLQFDLSPLAAKIPYLVEGGGRWFLNR
ncbi:MAG: hypothetical protein D6820_04800, partial [Lentisphaerae bacterium]